MAGGDGLLFELHQEMRVMSKKETGEPSARDAPPVLAIAGGSTGADVPVARGSCCGASGDWLVDITTESNLKLERVQQRRKPRIQRVEKILREARTNTSFFEPVVVSLGPYHHGRLELAAMEENKKAAAARFAGGQSIPMHLFYQKVREVAGAARECYADEFNHIGEEAFANMMFFDGCFILHFIDCCVKTGASSPTTNAYLHGFVTRDMFLLENQVPFIVLQALMSLRSVDYEKFIQKVTGQTTPHKTDAGTKKRWWWRRPTDRAEKSEHGAEEGPIHLLDLLRTKLLGRELPPNLRSGESNWQCFRSVKELKEAGIKFRKSHTCCLRDIEFEKGFLHGMLQLPQIVVDDLTRPRFLNLIALEMCPDSHSDYGVTSYVCFLDYLIDHADDVKELRRKEILLNALGNDQQVADLFNELATDLSASHFTYANVVMGINTHYRNKRKVSIVRMHNTHFSSPWTTISFVAAVFLIVLTTLQTIFTVFPKLAVAKTST